MPNPPLGWDEEYHGWAGHAPEPPDATARIIDEVEDEHYRPYPSRVDFDGLNRELSGA